MGPLHFPQVYLNILLSNMTNSYANLLAEWVVAIKVGVQVVIVVVVVVVVPVAQAEWHLPLLFL